MPCGVVSNEEPFPLKVFTCTQCWLMQTVDTVRREKLFNENYPYLSSYSASFREHIASYAEATVKKLSLNKQSKILEIGSNDGCLQDVFAKFGIEVLGVEPTGIAAKIAVAKGHSVIQKFFDAKTASQISDKYGKFDFDNCE